MGVTASSHPSAELTSTPDLVEARNHRPAAIIRDTEYGVRSTKHHVE